jgi:hypothetical protein
MSTGSWLLTAAGWGSVAGGVLVALAGVLLIGVLFGGRGVPVGGAGAVAIFSFGVGPLLAVAGTVAVVAGLKLGGGAGWARTYLELFFWMVAVLIGGYIAYEGSRIRSMEAGHVIRGALYFAFLGAPAIVMAIVVRLAGR